MFNLNDQVQSIVNNSELGIRGIDVFNKPRENWLKRNNSYTLHSFDNLNHSLPHYRSLGLWAIKILLDEMYYPHENFVNYYYENFLNMPPIKV